jgi:hypothetical protein
MRQDPIEITRPTASARRLDAKRKRFYSPNLPSEPRAIDEAFARFEPAHKATDEKVDRQIIGRMLVTDLSAQLEAIDRQCAQLAQLLRNVEANSLAK